MMIENVWLQWVKNDLTVLISEWLTLCKLKTWKTFDIYLETFMNLLAPRKGQWACDLDQPYRLIFTPHEDPIPTDADGKYIWLEILGVEVIEIVDYHN